MSKTEISGEPVDNRKKSLVSWLMLLGTGLTWGSSYWLIKKSLIHFSPAEVGALRLILAGIFYLPWLKSSLKSISKRHIFWLAMVALCGSGIPAFLFPIAQEKISSGVAGILSSTTPLFTIAVGVLFYGISVSKTKILGILVGFMGTLLLIIQSVKEHSQIEWFYAAILLIATFLYAISSNTVNLKLAELKTTAINVSCFIPLGLVSFTFLLLNGSAFRIFLGNMPFQAFLPLLALAFLGTFLASFVFFQLIKREGVVFSSTVSYIIPCMAVIIAALDGESLEWIHLLSMSIIIAGIYLIRR